MIAAIERRVVRQTTAVREVVDAYVKYLSGLSNPARPIASYLFVGPTGSGKTHVCKTIAEAVSGRPDALIRIDCAEFQHSHEIAKLIGAPPGYLGYRETSALLSTAKLAKARSDKCSANFILFDEIDKAHTSLLDILLGILDNGTLKLGDGTETDFRSSIIFLTGNTGAQEITKTLGSGYGFDGTTEHSIRDIAVKESRRVLRPEFYNRLTKVIQFDPLELQDMRAILDLELEELNDRIFNSKVPFVLTITDGAKEELATRGFDRKYGARHLQRAVEQHLTNPLARLVASKQVLGGTRVKVEFHSDRGFIYLGE